MGNRLEGKVAIITGGATGIGEAISKRFAEEGARVVVASFPEDPVEEVVNSIRSNGGGAVGFQGDLSDDSNAMRCVQLAVSEWGKLDILINNAGVFPVTSTIDEYPVDAFDYLIKNNIRSTFLMTKYAIPELAKTRGNIVAAGSESGLLGIAQNAPYGGTKGFIHGFIKGVAAEQAQNGIRANCVCPGAIDTAWTHKEDGPMDEEMENTMIAATPLGRRGTPEEIANAYLFLASDEASYVTGTLFSVDGGITISKGALGEKMPKDLSQQPEPSLHLKNTYKGATDMTR